MTDNYWKEIAKKDLGFNSLLVTLVRDTEIPKSQFLKRFNLVAKYELIRMESNGLIEFKENTVALGKNPDSLVGYYSAVQFKAVG